MDRGKPRTSDDYPSSTDVLRQAYRESLEENARLREGVSKLRGFVAHIYPCEARSPLYPKDCTCGLNAALDNFKGD